METELIKNLTITAIIQQTYATFSANTMLPVAKAKYFNCIEMQLDKVFVCKTAVKSVFMFMIIIFTFLLLLYSAVRCQLSCH